MRTPLPSASRRCTIGRVTTSKFHRPEGEIDFLPGTLMTEPGFAWRDIEGRRVALETPQEVMVRKLAYRAAKLPFRDAFDLAAVDAALPDIPMVLAEHVPGQLPRLVESLRALGTMDRRAQEAAIIPLGSGAAILPDTLERANDVVSRAMAVLARRRVEVPEPSAPGVRSSDPTIKLAGWPGAAGRTGPSSPGHAAMTAIKTPELRCQRPPRLRKLAQDRSGCAVRSEQGRSGEAVADVPILRQRRAAAHVIAHRRPPAALRSWRSSLRRVTGRNSPGMTGESMAISATQAAVPMAGRRPLGPSDSQGLLKSRAANELFFAVVGPVGAGSSHVARQLERCLKDCKLNDRPFTCETVKASDVIRDACETQAVREGVQSLPPLQRKVAMQERGDALRKRDHAAIAASAITRIAAKRADAQGVAFTAGKPVEPDGAPRAYIIDSLKHPAEAGLLRRLYGEAFVLIGVVCSPPVLRERLSNALFNGVERPLPRNIAALDEFISRDAGDPDKKHGQHVTDAFQEADFFVDNTKHVDMPVSGDFKDAIDQRLIGELDRLVSIILHTRILRPTVEESAMHAAYSAQLQSSCLSRQVGAALIDEQGNVVATGTNEVPKAGGGVYGEDPGVNKVENRCALCDNNGKGAYCSNNEQQNQLIEGAVKALFGSEIPPDELQAEAPGRQEDTARWPARVQPVGARRDGRIALGRPLWNIDHRVKALRHDLPLPLLRQAHRHRRGLRGPVHRTLSEEPCDRTARRCHRNRAGELDATEPAHPTRRRALAQAAGRWQSDVGIQASGGRDSHLGRRRQVPRPTAGRSCSGRSSGSRPGCMPGCSGRIGTTRTRSRGNTGWARPIGEVHGPSTRSVMPAWSHRSPGWELEMAAELRAADGPGNVVFLARPDRPRAGAEVTGRPPEQLASNSTARGSCTWSRRIACMARRSSGACSR